MLWLLGYDVIMIGLSWLTSWLCFELVPWETYGMFQSCIFNLCAVVFVVFVFKLWRFPILRKICHVIYGRHAWIKDPNPDIREKSVLKGREENVHYEFCLRCHRARLSFVSMEGKPKRYFADAEDNEMTREY